MRRQLTHRPLLLLAGAMGIGLASRHQPLLLIALLPLCWFVPTWTLRALVFACSLVGVLRAPFPVQSLVELRFVQGNAQVVSVPRVAGNVDSAILKVNGVRYVAYVPQDSDVSFGDVLSIVAVAHPLREGTDAYWTSKGVVGRLDIQSRTTTRKGLALLRWGRSWRDSFRVFTSKYLPSGSKEIADALCFNVDSELEDDLRDDLRRSGTVHIISAS